MKPLSKSHFDYADIRPAGRPGHTWVMNVPAGVKLKAELLQILAQEGRFPGYFGENWDALYDCLRDFHWLTEQNIVVYHEDVPLLGNVEECLVYLSILDEAVLDWRRSLEIEKLAVDVSSRYPSHSLTVIFPVGEAALLEQMAARQFKNSSNTGP